MSAGRRGWPWLAAVVVAAGCASEAVPAPGAAPLVPAPAAAVAAAPAAALAPAHPAPRPREAAAELVRDSDADAAVTPPLDALIEQVHVRAGDQVGAGAALVTVRLPAAALDAARVLGGDERITMLTARREALTRLLAEGLTRAADLAEVEARLTEARAERAVAQAALRAAGLRDAAAVAAAGGRLVLRAPLAGVVVEVAAVVGERRGPGDGALARVAGGGARRVVARWTAAPAAGPATLVLADGSRHALTVAATSPRRDADGAIAVWYDVAGAPLPDAAHGRVVLGGGP